MKLSLIQALVNEYASGNAAYDRYKQWFRSQDGEVIGAGDYGVVFDMGSPDTVYKVTSDEVELEGIAKAVGKKFKYLANVYELQADPSGKAGWYELERLRNAPKEVHNAISKGSILWDIGKYLESGDERHLEEVPDTVEAGGRTYSLHSFFKGAFKELESAGIDGADVDLTGDYNNIMMTANGDLKFIDY